jgi:single-strand DNA-binding protein
MNKYMILGHLGRDPELRHTQSGKAVTNFSVATSESWVKDGEKQERTEWHRVVCWGKLAETCAKFLSKGRQVLVEGKAQTREWEDKEGNKRQTTELNAMNVQFLGGGKGDNKGGGQQAPAPTDDDIPF